MKQEEKQSYFTVLWGWGKPYHSLFYSSVFLAVLGVASGMIPYFCAAAMIHMLLGHVSELSTYLFWCKVALSGYLGKVVFSSFSTAISHTATYYTLRDLRKKLALKLARVPMGTIIDTPSGQLKTTIVDRVEGMEPTLAHLIPEMTSNLLIPVAIFIYLLILDWRMALASMLTLIIGFFGIMAGMKNYPTMWQGAVAAGRDMANAVVEYIGGIQVVKAFSQSAGSYQKYADAVNYNAGYYVNWMRQNQKTMSFRTIIPGVLIAVLPLGFAFWISGSLETAEFLTIIILSLGFTGPIMAAMTFVDDLAVLSTNVGEISDLLEETELERPADFVALNSREIVLHDVSFSYQQDQNVLDHINLTIEPGSVTALVGPSGSGKSTIAKLIAGFWDVTSGSITLGGFDVRRIPMEQLNDNIAYVSQDNYLFDVSIMENIRMGRKNATDQEVIAAAKAAGCDEFIRLHGYQACAGGGGSHLSGGEKQRISIARAILKNAPIIILDEATASIDPENEAAIQKSLSSLIRGKTLLVIAHRLSTIEDSDNIVVVKDGTIVAQGRQDILLAGCPLYASMWESHLGTKDTID
ncbi:MAG: ABC transporter ATP-binding protein [Lachnospiraceae bacterium]